MSRRSRTLGGVLLLGWLATTAIWLIATLQYVEMNNGYTGVGRAGLPGSIELVLLAAAALLVIIFMRTPSDPEIPSSLDH